MGYYTAFQLSTLTETDADYHEALIKIVDYDPLEDVHKWYEHEADMKELSLQFPELTFKLEGEGEESGDLWKKYFHNGKMQYCPAIVTYEEFDEKKLKELEF